MTVSPVLLVAASSGYPAQLWPPRPWWHRNERFWITLRTADAAARAADPRPSHSRSAFHRAAALTRTTLTALRVFTRYRPVMVVVTETRKTSFLFFARLFGVPTLAVEVHDWVTTATRTALLCRPTTARPGLGARRMSAADTAAPQRSLRRPRRGARRRIGRCQPA